MSDEVYDPDAAPNRERYLKWCTGRGVGAPTDAGPWRGPTTEEWLARLTAPKVEDA